MSELIQLELPLAQGVPIEVEVVRDLLRRLRMQTRELERETFGVTGYDLWATRIRIYEYVLQVIALGLVSDPPMLALLALEAQNI